MAKAGIICTLNARCAVLAAANPVDSKYNPKKNVVDNIKLPPTLLSRFDLIYLLLDRQHETTDRRLANHIVGLYSSMYKGVDEAELHKLKSNIIDRELLARYISYARKYINPIIPDYVQMDFISAYTDMRKMGNSTKTVTATPRQLESMIRLAEAFARMRLSPTVESVDV